MIVENCPYARDPRVRKETKALMAAGFRVSVICPRQGKERWHEVSEGVSIYRFSAWPGSGGAVGYLAEYGSAMLAIVALTIIVFIREGFDIIHAANPPDLIVPISSVYRLIGKLVIYDQHDLSLELYEAKFGKANWFLRWWLLLFEKRSYQLANHTIVTNESYKELAMKRGQLHESKITVVRNGPDTRDGHILDADPELRSRSSNIIAFAGVTGSQDGLDQLCRALHHLRYELGRDDFYCVVLGDGDALEDSKVLARKLDIDDRVWFAGWVTEADRYARCISTADICVSPSPGDPYNDRSTFIKIMEYMAAGKPIVSYDLLETRRSAEGAALYARPNDARDFGEKIANLMADPILRQSMGEAGRLRVHQELAWKYSVTNLLNAYDKVTKSCTESGVSISNRAEHRSRADGKVA